MDEQADPIATRSTWKNRPLPDQRVRLPFTATYTLAEFELIRRGLIPHQMDDKWFIYLDGEWLSFHRSWTGFCFYRLRLEWQGEQYIVTEAWVSRDASQYLSASLDFDTEFVQWLIDTFLLKKPVPYEERSKRLDEILDKFKSVLDEPPDGHQ